MEKFTFFKNEKVKKIVEKKGKEPIVMLTCYDYSFSCILDDLGLDIILVGDSLANVILGMERTKEVNFEEMLYHTKAVKKAAKNTMVIADMPYCSYQVDPSRAVYFARRFIQEAGADAVKIEWFKEARRVTEDLVKEGISVMGHIGLTPQRVDELGGYKVQGRELDTAKELIEQAKIFEDAGAFSLVLECIPKELSKIITQRLSIPTIGIGAGIFCDGQVLVLYDILGIYQGFRPKFIKVYKDLSLEIKEAVNKYIKEVKEKSFPSSEHSFSLPPSVRRWIKEIEDNFEIST